jgi:hypothetical protein
MQNTYNMMQNCNTSKALTQNFHCIAGNSLAELSLWEVSEPVPSKLGQDPREGRCSRVLKEGAGVFECSLKVCLFQYKMTIIGFLWGVNKVIRNTAPEPWVWSHKGWDFLGFTLNLAEKSALVSKGPRWGDEALKTVNFGGKLSFILYFLSPERLRYCSTYIFKLLPVQVL